MESGDSRGKGCDRSVGPYKSLLALFLRIVMETGALIWKYDHEQRQSIVQFAYVFFVGDFLSHRPVGSYSPGLLHTHLQPGLSFR